MFIPTSNYKNANNPFHQIFFQLMVVNSLDIFKNQKNNSKNYCHLIVTQPKTSQETP